MTITKLKDANVHSIYLAGPMSGIDEYNFPAFNKATADMRSKGITVFNPAELDNPWDTNKPSPFDAAIVGGERWQMFLRRDLLIIISLVQGVVCLDGWEKSKGARLETHVAWELSIPVFKYPSFELVKPFKRIVALENTMGALMGANGSHKQKVKV